MKVGIGYSDNPDTVAAGKQAVERAMEQTQRSDPCDMVLLFSTAQHDPAVLLESVASAFGYPVPIYGGGTAGVFTTDYFGYAGDQIGIACFWLDSVRCDVLTESGMRESELDTGLRLGRRLGKIGTQPDTPIMLFYDAVDVTGGFRLLMAAPLLEGLAQGLGFHPDLSGIGMIGDIGCGPAKQWIKDTVSVSNAIALAFSGDIRVDTIIMHGCRPATPYYTVTKASGPVILEINGKPAIPFIDELLNSAITPEQYPFFLMFGINHGERWGEYNEEYYASRLCLGIDKASNGIVMFEPDMVEGTEFQIMYRSLELDYIKPNIDKVFAAIGDRQPIFALHMNCAGRCAGYAGTDYEDAVVIQKAVADRVPMLGLFSGVEVAPIGGQPRGLDWTGVFCLFSQSKGSTTSAEKTTEKPVWKAPKVSPASKEISVNAVTRMCEHNLSKILELDTTATAIRMELEQKRRGFALLTELAVSLQHNAGYSNVFIPVTRRVNAALNMQRTIVLEKKNDGRFSAVVLQGYSAEEKIALAGKQIEVPPELLDPDHPVVVSGADSPNRFKPFRELLGLPYFVSAPVMLRGEVFAILITGRCVEAIPYLIRLSHGDAETVQAISTLLSSVLAGQRLAITEERNRIMLEAMPMCCVFWDENGNLADCNPETLALFKLSSKEEFLESFLTLEPKHQPEGFLTSEEGAEIVQKAFVSGGAKFKWMHLTTVGELFPTEVTLVRVPQGDSYALVGYIRDLRDQEAAVRHAKAKNEFLASVSHEIRTPLNAIQSMARIADELKNISEDQQYLIEQGVQSITLLTSAIDTILDFSKIDTGQLALDAFEFSPRSLVTGICDMVRANVEEKSLYLRTSFEADVPDLLLGDAARLQQVIFNIVMNAIKFTESGGIEVSLYRDNTGTPRTGASDSVSLIFEVRDTGVGIPDKHMANLFIPLFSGETAYDRKYEGLGMGLTISNGLVTLMGGKIACESRVGEGSIFRVHVTFTHRESRPRLRKPSAMPLLRIFCGECAFWLPKTTRSTN